MAHRIAEKQVDLPPLRVLHRGLAMVADYRALKEAGTRRHIGLRFDSTLGPEDVFVHPRADGTSEQVRGNHGGFVKLVDEVVTISPSDPYYGEYVRHLKDGDLWAADPETANAAGVLFEPEFGDEHPETTKGDVAQAFIKARTEREVASKKAAQDIVAARAKAKAPTDGTRVPSDPQPATAGK